MERRHVYRGFALGLVWFVLGMAAQARQTASFPPVADASVHREAPLTNFGGGPISVDWENFSISNSVRRAFLRFEVTGADPITLDCLTLRLTTTATGGGTTHFDVRRVTSTWDETSVTWEDQPTVGGALGSSTREVVDGETVYISLDPEFIKRSGTYDLALVGTTYGGTLPIEFDGRDGASPPALILGCENVPQRAGFSARIIEGVAPLTIEFENQSGGAATTWVWDFGDGTSSTLEDPPHIYSEPGRYSVQLTASGPSGTHMHERRDYVFAHPPDTPLGEVITWEKISQTNGGNTPVLDNEDMFGRSVDVLGDLDDDGIPDLIVGAVGDDDATTETGEDFPGLGDDNRANNPGAAYILFMRRDGSVRDYQKISNLYGGLQETLENIDGFGRYVAGIGDLDGDGIVDAAVGSTRDDDGGLDQGAIYILFLNRDGTVRAETKISETSGGFDADLDPDDQIGRGVTSMGDLDGDGIQDLATGATGDDDGGLDRGAVYILFMRRDGTVRRTQKISELVGGLQTDWVGFWFGMDVDCLGDVDGDGRNDLAVGVLLEQAVPNASGAAFVLLLNADGTVKGEAFINNFQGLVPGELSADDEFGGAVAGLGDLDGDGTPDLAVGSIRDDDNARGDQELTLDYGAAYVFFLNPDGSVREYQKISATRGNFDARLDNHVRFAEALGAGGDFDGDGYVDLFSGSRFDRDGGGNRGAVYLLRLRGGTVPPLAADFQAAPAVGDAPLTVGFFDASAGAVTAYTWDFGDGGSSAQKDPVHVYAAPGTYDVSLSVRGAAGTDTVLRQAFVTAVPPQPPSAAFRFGPDLGEAPLTVAFDDLSTGSIDAWLWDFGDGATSTAQHPVHVYTSEGTYDVSLTTTGPLGSDTVAEVAGVIVGTPAAPVAVFGGGPLLGDAPLQVAFQDATFGRVSSWSWDFGDGTHSNRENPTHVYARPGTYDVTLTVNGPGGTASSTQQGFVQVGGEVPSGLSDGGFEAQVVVTTPLAPWVVLSGNGHRVAPLSLGSDSGMPSEGVQWLEVSGDGSFAATSPSTPAGFTIPAMGASGVAQVFRLPVGSTVLAFETSFVLAGPLASTDFNDWMSVDLSDGERTFNLFYRDSFSDFPLTSEEHGLPTTEVARVRIDLAHVFPAANADTIFTLSVQVGNGGDGASPSIARVDGFRLERSDPSIERLGCGVNPLGSLTVLQGAPVLGTRMTFGIENPLGTQSPGSLSGLLVSLSPDPNTPCGTLIYGTGMAGPRGELLVNVSPPDPLAHFGGTQFGGVGVPSLVQVQLPNQPTLAGLTVFLQGYLYDGTSFNQRLGFTDGLRMTVTSFEPSGLSNLSRGKPARQSSALGSFAVAGRAVDGSTDGDFFGDSVSHTTFEENAFWEVDLGTVNAIEWIDVWNRTDCCGHRLEGAHVFVSDVPFVSDDLSAIQAQADVYALRLNGVADTLNRVPVGRTGRFVRIQHEGTGYLQLAEVEVVGVTMPAEMRVAGLEGMYFAAPDLRTLMLTRTDASVDFDFGLSSPDPALPDDGFSVRWRGFLEPRGSETVTFFADTTDGARLWIDGQLIIDSWFDRERAESSGTIELELGRTVPLVFEYYETSGEAVARLLWQGSFAKEVLPADRLSHWAN